MRHVSPYLCVIGGEVSIIRNNGTLTNPVVNKRTISTVYKNKRASFKICSPVKAKLSLFGSVFLRLPINQCIIREPEKSPSPLSNLPVGFRKV